MTIKIDKKITGYEVVKEEPKRADSNVVHMHEKLERPETLLGSTYKIKTPLTEHALYVTINDIVLNQDTPHEKRRPFEIFINSKDMTHFQWVVALTRVLLGGVPQGAAMSPSWWRNCTRCSIPAAAISRRASTPPRWWPRLATSLSATSKMIGLIPTEALDEHQQRFIEQKRREAESRAVTRENCDGGEARRRFRR